MWSRYPAFALVSTNGKLMKIPSCSQYSKLAELSAEDLEEISGNENTMMIAGENYYIKAVNIR